MKKIIKLTESDLTKIIKTVLNKKSYIFEEKKIGCIQGNCTNGEGTEIFEDGSKYEGNYKNYNFNGDGCYTNPKKYKFCGQWKKVNADSFEEQNVLNGKLSLNDLNKMKTRCVEGDCKNGKGYYIYSDLSSYNGMYKNEEWNGKGTYTNTKGITFSGNWKDSKLNGHDLNYYDKQYSKIDFINTTTQNVEDKLEKCKEKIDNLRNEKKYSYTTDINKITNLKILKKNEYEFQQVSCGGKTYYFYRKIKNNNPSPTLPPPPPPNITPTPTPNPTPSPTPPPTVTDCSTSTQPTTATHRYEGDRNYEYAQVGDCWWAHNVNNDKWFNISQMAATTNPKFQSSIDNLNNGKTNGKLVMILGS
jgi:hypothetical protein